MTRQGTQSFHGPTLKNTQDCPIVVLFASAGCPSRAPIPSTNINMTLAYCSSSSTVVVTRPLGFLTLTAWT